MISPYIAPDDSIVILSRATTFPFKVPSTDTFFERTFPSIVPPSPMITSCPISRVPTNFPSTRTEPSPLTSPLNTSPVPIIVVFEVGGFNSGIRDFAGCDGSDNRCATSGPGCLPGCRFPNEPLSCFEFR